MLGQQPQDKAGRQHADRHEKPALPAARIGQKAERRPGVVDQGKVQPARDQFKSFAKLEMAQYQVLGDQIEHDHQRGKRQPGRQQPAAPNLGAV